ncbi:hypothetical protein [Streptomyces olivoreticuli]|uniref:hypothetical protein n=1 Tax=Streptomyces olivoreticuli TaxID=68246 RepID=UPI0013C30BE6|nr:hypothetical protein [Streptomyces olivoreticuli]
MSITPALLTSAPVAPYAPSASRDARVTAVRPLASTAPPRVGARGCSSRLPRNGGGRPSCANSRARAAPKPEGAPVATAGGEGVSMPGTPGA